MDHTAKKWKPSELETAILKIQFQTNPQPTLDEKESILKNLKVKFNSQVRLAQLTGWFENERERAFNKPNRVCKNSYRKFQKEEIDYLAQSFSQDNYPKLSTMTTMAEQMDCSLSKIENWYKHNRRLLAQQGCIKFKARKYFKKDELTYLLNLFNVDPCPNKQKMIEMAEKLNCDRYQIKNWYSNRRKKFRILDRKHNNCQEMGVLPETGQQVYLSSPESMIEEPYIDYETPQPYTIEELVPPSPSDQADAFIRTENYLSYGLQITQETTLLQNPLDNWADTESNISLEIFENQVLNQDLPTESSQETDCTTSSPLPCTKRDQSSNTENLQENQIMPRNAQPQMSFQPFGHSMYQGMSPMNMMPGSVMLQPIPAQNMFLPYVHYPNAWQQPMADAPFGGYAQPTKKIFVMSPVPMNVIQNPVKYVVFY